MKSKVLESILAIKPQILPPPPSQSVTPPSSLALPLTIPEKKIILFMMLHRIAENVSTT
jgi:hypothetical protein